MGLAFFFLAGDDKMIMISWVVATHIFLFSALFKEKISNLTSIFFRWVETTNQSVSVSLLEPGEIPTLHLMSFSLGKFPAKVGLMWGSD